MQRFEHGGDVYTHPGVVDFSASLNPVCHRVLRGG